MANKKQSLFKKRIRTHEHLYLDTWYIQISTHFTRIMWLAPTANEASWVSVESLWSSSSFPSHSGQTRGACVVPAIILQREIQTNVESLTLTAKLKRHFWKFKLFSSSTCSEWTNCIHKFYRRKILFMGTFYVSFSYELRARKSLNWFKLQGYERP